MEGYLLPPFSVLGGPVCALPAPGGNWGKREGRFMTPQGLNYLELCKTILSQVSPGRAAPLRKANTRDCGVQVNAKVEKIVQCSLGPKTLLCPDCDGPPAPWKPPTSPGVLPDTPVASLRFLRPVSIYSPVFDRRIVPRRLGEDGAGDGGAEAAERDEELQTTFHRSGRGSNFQFLEQRYGFFHCKKCNIRWESAYVWCISGTSKVYYKQLCRKCQMRFNPYRVEPILCKGCSQTCCTCEKKQRHINMKRPHRQDLCCRCKDMRLSCDATYSFKYIV